MGERERASAAEVTYVIKLGSLLKQRNPVACAFDTDGSC